MHATVCLPCAGQSGSAGHAAKSGQFKGQFSWVKYDPTVVKGLTTKLRKSSSIHIFMKKMKQTLAICVSFLCCLFFDAIVSVLLYFFGISFCLPYMGMRVYSFDVFLIYVSRLNT